MARRSRIPRHLLAGLVGSSLTHAGAAVLAGVLLQGDFLHFRPPARGVNSSASAPSAIVLEGAWADERPTPARLAGAPAAPAPVEDPVLEARKLAVTRVGRLPASPGESEKSSAPVSDREPPIAPPAMQRAADDSLSPEADSSENQAPPELQRSRGRKRPTPTLAATVSSSPAPASAESHGAQTDAPLEKRFSPNPEYPPDALAAHLEGRVLLRVRVDRGGRVDSISVLQSSGVRSLDRAALEAVRRWRFAPAHRAGVAVSSEVAVPIRFLIDE